MSGVRLEAKVHMVTGGVSAAQNIVKCVRRCGLDVEDIVLEQLASSAAVLGEDEKAMEWAEHALKLNPDDPATRYNSACFFAKFEDSHERALDLLASSVVSRSWIANDSSLDPLRVYPRFKEIFDSLPE